MERSILAEWWKEIGSKELNKILIELVGEKIGYVPLENLLAEFCDPSTLIDEEELIPLMVTDGATLRVEHLKDGQSKLLIWVK